MPSFDKSLLCSEFFTNQNCTVLAIDDSLYVLKLNSKVLERRLSDMISNSELTGDMVLNIERENGLYMTTEKAIRKAFNKSTGTGLVDPIQVGSHHPIKVGLATPIPVGSRKPIPVGLASPIEIGSQNL